MTAGSLLKGRAKAFATGLVDEYRLNWVVASADGDSFMRPTAEAVQPLNADARAALEASTTPKVRASLKFSEAGLDGLALRDAGLVVSVAHFAAQRDYDRHGTWPLAGDEIALVDIATEERARGRGHAVRLIREAAAVYRSRGARRLIAYIWWTNRPSLSAFRKAGWRRIGFSIEWRIGARWRGLRIPLSFR